MEQRIGGDPGMRREKILIVEDESAILEGLKDLLTGEGYPVCTAADGRQALEAYRQEKPDLILLDVMIPEISGYDVCREIRKTDPVTSIIMLTAKGQEVDKVIGLELGADDYVVKPFGVAEILARIRAVLRRVQADTEQVDRRPIRFGDVTIDPSRMEGSRGDEAFAISRREIMLLRLFIDNESKVLDRNTILDKIWGIRYEGTTRTLDQHILQLRKKIEETPAVPRYILTVHGVGYRFRGDRH